MTKTGLMVITGNSIAELEANLSAMKAAMNSGATMCVGGTSLADVEKGLDTLSETVGYESPAKCGCGCCKVKVEETVTIPATPTADPVEEALKMLMKAMGI